MLHMSVAQGSSPKRSKCDADVTPPTSISRCVRPAPSCTLVPAVLGGSATEAQKHCVLGWLAEPPKTSSILPTNCDAPQVAFRDVSASPIVVVMVPRTRILFYGDPVFAEDQVCLEAANRRSARSLRGKVLSVRKCCCCHVYTTLCAPLGNARTAAEAAAAEEEDGKMTGRCVDNSASIVGGPASWTFIPPHNHHPEAASILLSLWGWYVSLCVEWQVSSSEESRANSSNSKRRSCCARCSSAVSRA
jgi:hypothetical protein